MNFILDEQKHIKIFLNGLYSSLLVGNQCVLGVTNQGIVLLQNAQNFEQLVCLRDQCHIISFNEDMFGVAQVGVPLSCFMANGHLDKQTVQKNIKLTECFIDINLDTFTKPLRSLSMSIKKLQIQLGYRVNNQQLVKKIALQLCLNCFLIDGSIFEQTINVKEILETEQMILVYKNAIEMFGLIPEVQTQMQSTIADKLLLLCFDHNLGQELKIFNQDEGLDLQLDKEYIKVVPVLTQSDLTFLPSQFIDYKFNKICEEYGWIKHLLIDPNFITPIQFMMRKHDLKGQLFLNRKREKKMASIYLCARYQNYMFSMSTSTSVINLYDENATEIDLNELIQVVEQVQNIVIPASQLDTDSNSKLIVNESNFFLLQDSAPRKTINFGKLLNHIPKTNQEDHLRYIQFAEEQSRNTQFAPLKSDEIRKARGRLFEQPPKEESKINDYQK